mmetsp:Transcript_4955/g.16025  ORF Transcript_4955/g.16025 Transcript_4955/m.16025 type:complete len:274 (+) Transcript_4955:2307-3128(+)
MTRTHWFAGIACRGDGGTTVTSAATSSTASARSRHSCSASFIAGVTPDPMAIPNSLCAATKASRTTDTASTLARETSSTHSIHSITSPITASTSPTDNVLPLPSSVTAAGTAKESKESDSSTSTSSKDESTNFETARSRSPMACASSPMLVNTDCCATIAACQSATTHSTVAAPRWIHSRESTAATRASSLAMSRGNAPKPSAVYRSRSSANDGRARESDGGGGTTVFTVTLSLSSSGSTVIRAFGEGFGCREACSRFRLRSSAIALTPSTPM